MKKYSFEERLKKYKVVEKLNPEYNLPDNFEKIINEEKWHDTKKGCKVNVYKFHSNLGDFCVNKYCETHKKWCSKTGWEIGWHGGTDNRKKEMIIKNCELCGKNISGYTNKRYCEECAKIITKKNK